MGTAKTEQLPHDEGFIVSEAPGTLSREQVTIVPRTSAYEAGTVMSKRDDGKWEHFDPSSSEQPDTPTRIGVLCSRVDTSNGAGGLGVEQKGVVIERLAEVRADDLIWIGNTTAEQATGEASLLAQDIKIRTSAARVETQTT